MNKRIQALETLRRLEERELTALSQQLCAAQNARAEAEARIAHLDQRAAHEASSRETEALPYIGRFLATLRREQGREALRAQALGGQIEGLRDEVMDHFTREKTYDQLSQGLRRAMTAERSRQSEAALEDLTTARFGC